MALPLLPLSPVAFPNPRYALDDPDGLLAAGGDLSPEWLLAAYQLGIFPWFDDDEAHILWWSPKERAVLRPGQMRITKSLRKRLRNFGFECKVDQRFEAVIDACQTPRAYSADTWITARMRNAYVELHQLGFAHSVEIYHDQQLVGGLYGISLGTFFFGESMFSRCSDASKVAFFCLQTMLEEWSFTCIDCQMENAHLTSLGVQIIKRAEFLDELEMNPNEMTKRGKWQLPQRLANSFNL